MNEFAPIKFRLLYEAMKEIHPEWSDEALETSVWIIDMEAVRNLGFSLTAATWIKTDFGVKISDADRALL